MKIMSFAGYLACIIFGTSVCDLTAQALVLPEKYPAYNITQNNNPSEGYVFMTTRAVSNKAPASLIAIDNFGTPIYYKHLPEASGGFTVNRNGMLTYRTGDRFYMMDSSYNVVDSIWMEGYEMDGHDFLALENGHFIIFGSDYRIVDMTSYGGVADATVEGCIIQELDAYKNVVFEWNSWDHYSIEDTYKDLTTSAVELVHPNSLALDYDGAILMVARAMDEVTKISRETGEIVWRLGGKNNQFTFSDERHKFSLPHDFRYVSDGHYTIFDNGNNKEPAYSRGVEYLLDTDAMTCELVWEFDANKQILGKSGGSTRRLASGNTIIGYGGKASWPACVEVNPDGALTFQLDFVEKMSSGRSTKFPWRTTLFEPSTYSVNFGEWDGYTESKYILKVKNNSNDALSLTGYSVRSSAFTIEEVFPLEIPEEGEVNLTVVYFPEDIIGGFVEDVLTIDSDINSDTLIQRVSQQIQLKGTLFDNEAPEVSLVKLEIPEGDSVISQIEISFTEPIFNIDGEDFTYALVDDIVSLKASPTDTEEFLFNAVINSEMDKIVIFPEDTLLNSKSLCLQVSNQYQDKAGNKGEAYSEQLLLSNNDNIRNELPLSVYPNPSYDIFELQLPERGQYFVKVFGIDGSLLKVTYLNDEDHRQIDLSEFESGSYFLFAKNLESGKEHSKVLLKK